MKSKFKFIANIIPLISSFLALVYACYAWFSCVRNTNVSATIMLFDNSLIEDVKIYPYYILDSGRTEGVYTFDKSPLVAFDMGKYSLMNRDYQILIEVQLTEYASTRESLDLVAVSAASNFLGEIDEITGLLKEDLKLENNSLTSIICFYSFLEEDVTDFGSYFSVELNETNNLNGKSKNFVDNYTLNPIVSVSNYLNASKIYIVLDYDIELIEYIYSMNLGNPVISNIDSMEEDGSSYISYIADFYFKLVDRGESL